MASPNTISFSLLSSLNSTVDYATKKSTLDLIMARVSYVLLDDSDKEKFDSLGGWKAIGTIECRPFVNYNDPNSDPIIARPISSNLTRYPLVNEIVLLKVLVSKEAQNSFDNYKPEVYYTDIISVFNATEQNAAPDRSYFQLNPNEKFPTGKYIPSGEIKRLIKAPGDVTLEGRRGNSIRLGTSMTGFNTPWKSQSPKPILVISNNPQKTKDASARFESVNDDGSLLVMMSGHNINFQAASDNFDSYNAVVTIPEKNNVVVTDQQPKSKPEESLKKEDEKPIPKETVAEKKPVSTPEPVSEKAAAKEDEEQLPEREDLLEVNIDFEEAVSSVGTAETKVVDSKALTDAANKEATAKTKTTYSKKQLSRASIMNNRVLSYIKTTQGTGFLEKLTKICNKYNINVADMLTVMAFESGGDWPKGALKNSSGKVLAAGLIQFTDAKNNSVFKNIKSQPQFSSLNQLSDILNVPSIKTKNDTSKYTFDQLDLVDYYLSSNKSRLSNPVNGKVDKYAVYGIIFFPEIINNGTVSKPDYYVLGSSSKSETFPYLVGKWNPAINDGYPITVIAFKNFVDSLFSSRR